MATTETVTASKAADPKRRRQIQNFIGEHGFIVIFVFLLLILAITTPSFRTLNNAFTVLRQASIIAIVAIGAHFIILLGGIDLSLASNLSLSGVVMAALLARADWHPIAAALGALSVGALVGMVNGLVVTRLRINAIIATLGMSSVVDGMSLSYTQGKTIFGDQIEAVEFLSRGRLNILLPDPLPIPIIIMLALFVVAALILNYTTFGAHVFAIGNNEKAAWLSGLNVGQVRRLAFTLAGLLAGFGGIMQVARQGTATGTMGSDFLFPVLTAVVLGGASLSGGRGKLRNTLIAAIFLTTITNSMVLLGIDIHPQRIVSGLILIIALSLDRLRAART